MSTTIQDNTAYTEGNTGWSDTGSDLAVVPVNTAFDALPTVLANDQLVSAVIDDLVQDIAQDEAATQGQPLSEDEQILHELLNMSRQWIAMSVIQQVYESNMQVLRSISGVKSEANNFLKRSEDYVTNPFISLSLIDQMNSGGYGLNGSDLAQGNVDTARCLPEDGLTGDVTEQEMYNQLIATLTQQWLDLQSGQTAWQGLSTGLDSLVYNNALTNNRLDNQNTTMGAQITNSDLQNIMTQLQNLL